MRIEPREPPICFFVPGKPEPAGSKRMAVEKDAVGRVRSRRVVDDNPKSSSWKRTVGQYALATVGRQLLDCPLVMRLDFKLKRPRWHFTKAGKLRAKAPELPAVKPDCLKLVRAVEDGLTGMLYTDDARIVLQAASKTYGLEQGVLVNVWLAKAVPD